jgi:hypothetical protein
MVGWLFMPRLPNQLFEAELPETKMELTTCHMIKRCCFLSEIGTIDLRETSLTGIQILGILETR